MNAWRRPWIGLFAAAVIAVPLPVQSGQTLAMASCAGNVVAVTIPGQQPPAPGGDDNDCCRKGCHSGGDRRKKQGSFEDSGCC